MVLPYCPVDLLHVLTACLLVKAVNILRDHTIQPPGAFHFRKDPVRFIRYRSACIQVLSVVIKKDFRLCLQALMTEQIFRLISSKYLPSLFIQAVLTPEIRNSALC